jgi:hypothetical protein
MLCATDTHRLKSSHLPRHSDARRTKMQISGAAVFFLQTMPHRRALRNEQSAKAVQDSTAHTKLQSNRINSDTSTAKTPLPELSLPCTMQCCLLGLFLGFGPYFLPLYLPGTSRLSRIPAPSQPRVCPPMDPRPAGPGASRSRAGALDTAGARALWAGRRGVVRHFSPDKVRDPEGWIKEPQP